MNHQEKRITPHAVYRFYAACGALLYIGCSYSPFNRLSGHTSTKDWYQQISRITLEWHPGWLEGARAEATAIRVEHPRHNKLRMDPARVGVKVGRIPGPPRSDGFTCPKCGGPKKHRTRPYCPPCGTAYRIELKRARGWVPKRGVPVLICPRCQGPKEASPAYCKPCKKAVNKEYRRRKKLEKDTASLIL